MKFTIESPGLLKVLNDLAKVVPAKATLPILSCFLLEAKDNLLRITASDSEIALRGLVKPDSIEGVGKTCVNAKLLLDLIRTLPAGPVVFDQKDESSVDISWGSGQSSMPLFDAADYPVIAAPPKTASRFETTSETLQEGIAKTIFAVGTDESKPVLCGLYFDMQPQDSYIVASDSRKLVCYSFKTPGQESKASFILPSKGANILKGILPKETPVKVVFDEKNAKVVFGAIEMITRLVTGKYPNYRSIVPTQNENILNVDREKLLGTLRRMAVLADKKATLVKVNLSFNSMDITSEDLSLKTRGTEKVEADYDGADMSIALSIPTMVETLSSVSAEKVEIRLKDKRKAVLIQPSEDVRSTEPYEAVVMPYAINNG